MKKLKQPETIQEEKKSKPKSSLFTRGYNAVSDKVAKGSRFTMSCYNCEYYYQAVGDSEEVCQNPDVLKYDMTITENSIYCNRWKLCHAEKRMFKKGR